MLFPFSTLTKLNLTQITQYFINIVYFIILYLIKSHLKIQTYMFYLLYVLHNAMLPNIMDISKLDL